MLFSVHTRAAKGIRNSIVSISSCLFLHCANNKQFPLLNLTITLAALIKYDDSSVWAFSLTTLTFLLSTYWSSTVTEKIFNWSKLCLIKKKLFDVITFSPNEICFCFFLLVLIDNTALSVGGTCYDETKVRKSCSNYNEHSL